MTQGYRSETVPGRMPIQARPVRPRPDDRRGIQSYMFVERVVLDRHGSVSLLDAMVAVSR